MPVPRSMGGGTRNAKADLSDSQNIYRRSEFPDMAASGRLEQLPQENIRDRWKFLALPTEQKLKFDRLIGIGEKNVKHNLRVLRFCHTGLPLMRGEQSSLRRLL